MILVTGAGGKTGKAIIQALVEKGQRVRAFAHSAKHKSMLVKIGANEVLIGDMLDPKVYISAAEGVQAIYHICPNVHPNEVEMGENAIQAALQARVDHFVYHSVLHPQIEAMPHHWLKMRVEELIIASGLPFTILQPTAYMQNILSQWSKISESGIFSVPYSVDTRVSLVNLIDAAEAAAVVLTKPGHVGATYELCGPDFLSQSEVADKLSKASKRAITAKQISIDEWETISRNTGLGDYQIDALTRMFAYYEMHQLQGNPIILNMLLRRESTSLKSLLSASIQPP